MSIKSEQIVSLLEPIVISIGYEFVGLEYISQGRHSILRIYIDNPEGVTVDDCALVSRQVGAVLDVEDPVSGEYSLEVSSPGMNRPLFKLEHYEQFIGEEAKLKTFRPQHGEHIGKGQRKFRGFITSIEGNNIFFEIEKDQIVSIPFNEIETANLVAKF